MKKSLKRSLWIVALGVAMGASACRAQPADGPGLAQNPDAAEVQRQALDKAMAEGRKQAEAMMAMTPAQRRDWLENTLTQQFRAMMTAGGLGDPALQDRIVLFLRDQSTARVKLRESAARVRDAIADKKSTPEQLASLLATYKADTEIERARKAQADADLSAELELSKSPKLESFLRLYGVIGDSAGLVGGLISGMGITAMLPEPGELAKPQ